MPSLGTGIKRQLSMACNIAYLGESHCSSQSGERGDFTNSPGVHIAFRLVVWSLSGVPADQKTFQQVLHDYWRHHGEAKQHQSMKLSSNGWIAELFIGQPFHQSKRGLMGKWLENALLFVGKT